MKTLNRKDRLQTKIENHVQQNQGNKKDSFQTLKVRKVFCGIQMNTTTNSLPRTVLG